MNQATDDVVSLRSMPHSQINCQETVRSRSHRSTLNMYALRPQIKFRSFFQLQNDWAWHFRGSQGFQLMVFSF